MAQHHLLVKDLICAARLGCTAEERAQPQEVRVTLRLTFRRPPLATQTDRLEDTVCYAQLAKTVNAVCESQPFATVEYLTAAIFKNVRTAVSSEATLQITLHKVHPPVEGLMGGVFYTCEDSAD